MGVGRPVHFARQIVHDSRLIVDGRAAQAHGAYALVIGIVVHAGVRIDVKAGHAALVVHVEAGVLPHLAESGAPRIVDPLAKLVFLVNGDGQLHWTCWRTCRFLFVPFCPKPNHLGGFFGVLGLFFLGPPRTLGPRSHLGWVAIAIVYRK